MLSLMRSGVVLKRDVHDKREEDKVRNRDKKSEVTV